MPAPRQDAERISALRRDAETIFRAAVAAVEPRAAVLAHCAVADGVLAAGDARLRLDAFRRIVVIGAGKASAAMAQGVEELLGGRIAGGVVAVKHGHTAPLRRLRLVEAGHPVPDADGVAAAAALEAAVRGLGADDLVVVCLSGGASALIPAPRPPLTLADKQAVTRELLASGADIHAVNTVRRHLSRLKGGGLARAIAPATCLTLAISDVIGDDWSVIGSGPTMPDPSSFADALAVCRAAGILDRLPAAVAELLARGVAGAEAETPGPDDPCFQRSHRVLLASNALAVAAAGARARDLGYEVRDASGALCGEARLAGERLARAALALGSAGRRACLIAGGETTVTLGADPGLGGRSQELALAAACVLAGGPAAHPVALLAAGTDGNDGPTPAAGGVVDALTLARAARLGLDAHRHLARHDAHPLLAASGDLLVTGPTNTNVMDLCIAVAGPALG